MRQRMSLDLARISDAQLTAITGVVDLLEHRGAVDLLLRPVRSRLAQLRPARPLTLPRVLVLPFEELLVDAGEAAVDVRVIARSNLPAILKAALAPLPEARRTLLAQQASGATMLDGQRVLAIGRELWPLAARGLREAVPPSPGLAAALVGAAHLLQVGPQVVPLLWELPPRPVMRLEPEHVRAIAAVLRATVPEGPDALQWLIELLLARMMAPDVLLERLRQLEFGLPAARRDALLGQIVRGRIGRLRAASDQLGGGLQAAERNSVEEVLRLVAELDAVDGSWVSARTDRQLLHEVRKTVGARIDRCIEAALEGDMLGAFAQLAAPERLGDATMAALESQARAIRRLSMAGARLGVAASPEALLEPFLDAFKAALGSRMRSGASADGGLLEQVRILEILFGPDTAMALYDERRRPPAAR